MTTANSILSEIISYMKYAKYIPELKRRETFNEIVTRNMEMHIKKYPYLEDRIKLVYEKFIYTKKILPSMRSMQFAGKPIDINPTRIYNCAYLPIDDWRAFSETMFLLLGGSGVGFSVQNHHIEKLPEIRKPNPEKKRRYLIGDSIEGWADAVKVLMKSYFFGTSTINFDFSDIRPKGARLVTTGGKAPGPQPLKDCLRNIQGVLDSKNDGEKLTSIEVHDIVCYLADAVLAGGIRRAALISLFSADDDNMLEAKSSSIPSEILKKEYYTYTGATGVEVDENTLVIDVKQGNKIYKDIKIKASKGTFWDIEQYESSGTLGWWVCNPQRGRSNNSSVLLRHKVDKGTFNNIWKKIELSGSGEPGIYLTNDKDWGTNPCCEIALRPNQFCNLVEINASNIESQEDYNERAAAASFIATLQAGYTDFHYLRPIWQKTTEKDALIGVSMTGIASDIVTNLDMEKAATIVKDINSEIAEIIGINKSSRTTCVKPAGTTSLVLGTSSGIHAWHNDYYLRRIRVGKNESIYSYLSIYHPELIEDELSRPHDTAVITVPQKAPDNAITRHESVLDLLERIKNVSDTWVKAGHVDGQNTHNVSATISVDVNEWEQVGEWMWQNREHYNGLSVLPKDGGTYKQAPFEDCTKEQYEELAKTLHEVDLTKIIEFDDETDLKGELACAGGSCEII